MVSTFFSLATRQLQELRGWCWHITIGVWVWYLQPLTCHPGCYREILRGKTWQRAGEQRIIGGDHKCVSHSGLIAVASNWEQNSEKRSKKNISYPIMTRHKDLRILTTLKLDHICNSYVIITPVRNSHTKLRNFIRRLETNWSWPQ